MSFDLGKVTGPDGKGIQSITKTGTSGLIDTYTITYTDGTTSTFTVTNGSDGAEIVTTWESTLSDTKVPSEKLVKNTIDSKASSSHTHGNLTNDGRIGSTKGKFIVTGTGGVLEASDIEVPDGSLYVHKTDIVDDLTTNDNTKVLSAKQGKVLYDLISGIEEDMLL